MFYSHQLLARKAPLGQIWMAATMHAKINRRKLDKLNLIKICEEILNPSVPMALRLSGILMGGVVIVYERKVKLLYDDVTRLLVEINEAWKVKHVPDSTVLPRGKSQAKYRSVTLPDINDQMEIEQSLHFSNNNSTSFLTFHEAAYVTMRLDTVEEPFVEGENPREEEDLSQQQRYHQAESANITLMDPFESHHADSSLFDRFERFDIEGDEDPQMNFTPHERSQIPTSIRPSPPPPQEENIQQADEMQDRHAESQNNQQSNQRRSEKHQDEQKPGPTKRKARTRAVNLVMDYDQTIIPGHIYQSWLQDPSDIVTRRGRKNKPKKPLYVMKTTHLMELPPVALSEILGSASREMTYPGPLLELWMRCTQQQPAQDSPSRGTSLPHPPDLSWSSVPMNGHRQELPVQDSHSGVGSHPKQAPTEKQMGNFENIDLPMNEANLMFTPGTPGDNERSIPSSTSGNGFMPREPEEQLPSGRPNIKRRYSSSRHSGSSLATVAEENPWDMLEPDFKLRRLSENEPSDEPDMLFETGPTQTPHPMVAAHPIDKMTEAIRKQLKMHFDTPGAPQVESVNQLSHGMTRKKAAQLFYQTCVLASHDLLRVEQKVAYGDILISKGSKM